MENGSGNVENGSVKWKMEIGNAKWHGTYRPRYESIVFVVVLRRTGGFEKNRIQNKNKCAQLKSKIQ